MNGATIQEQPCPRCAIKRTVRYNAASFCFNCRLTWSGIPDPADLPGRRAIVALAAAAGSESTYAFSAPEVARLKIYRAAVQAHFFNDD